MIHWDDEPQEASIIDVITGALALGFFLGIVGTILWLVGIVIGEF